MKPCKSFDERLDSILVRAAIRLQERMQFAYSRGKLPELLMRFGLAAGLGEHACQGSLLEIQARAVTLMARNIREARRKGLLRVYLADIHMEELLEEPVMEERPVQKPRRRVAETHHPPGATVIALDSFNSKRHHDD